ncbi:type VII secretion system-associated protein [Streptomyces sp. NPDC056468]|uniref:type VII secretion system-associated protein n=1 Tax=Streptomyces sp. NPDC056468 TaxID=3345830 RepID=UPI003686E3C0
MPNVTVLNTEFLNQFITNHIETFSSSLEKMQKDDQALGPAISTVAEKEITNTTISASKPLVLGHLAFKDSPVGGADLNKAIQGAAAELQRIIDSHVILFDDLQEAMEETVQKLNSIQGKNLENISFEDFEEIFEDVETDLESPGSEETEKTKK